MTYAATSPSTSVFWHLSDLHFGYRNTSTDLKNPPTFGLDAWSEEENAALLERAQKTSLDFLIISGDLIDSGRILKDAAKQGRTPAGQRKLVAAWSEQATMRAVQFIGALATAVGLGSKTKTHVLVCPGNHDVEWLTGKSHKALAGLRRFVTSTPDFLTPFSKAPWLHEPSKHVLLLPLSTVQRGGTTFRAGKTTVQADAPSFEIVDIDKQLAKIAKHLGAPVPKDCLGICVSHHPPGLTPYPGTEVKFFSDPIGAGAAKVRLMHAGFRMFLHGHRHTGAAQKEQIFHLAGAGAEAWLVGAPSLSKAEGGFRGLNEVRVAVGDGGEANILVTPIINSYPAPKAEQPWAIRVASRLKAEAESIKFLERITPEGHSRSDITFSGISVPPAGQDLHGWKSIGNSQIEYTIPRLVQSDVTRTGDPKVAALQTGCEASVAIEGVTGRHHLRVWSIRLTCGRDAKSVGVVERSFSACGYATSRRHQEWVSGRPSMLPDGRIGEEAVVFTVRSPAQSLEFFLRWPDELSPPPHAEIRAYVETLPHAGDASPDLALPSEDLLSFSEWRIDSMWQMKRCRATIKRPLTGVAYALVWTLPTQDPKLSSTSNPQQFQAAVVRAEGLRQQLYASRSNQSSGTYKPFRDLVEWLESTLDNMKLLAADELEVSLFCPKGELARADDTGKVLPPATQPELHPVWARTSDVSWSELQKRVWEMGKGLAGRAFTTNHSMAHVSERAGFYQPRVDQWSVSDTSAYERLPDGPDHTVLYALPIRHPDASDVVLGVLCIGSYRDRSRLDLTLPPFLQGSELKAGQVPRSLLQQASDRLSMATRKALDSLEGRQ